ncbi:MAG: ribonuclease PH [Proteobacteria bacterium]|nr:ribonuclease PH [Pseudomonadota bacterium]
MSRSEGRGNDGLRSITISRGWTVHAEGSVLISSGRTRVLCNASIEEKVPPFLVGTGRGWVTAEYAMLPRATHTRSSRERGSGSGRSQEISRLIGRALRATVDLEALGPRTITLDCDVLQADGGTRTAAINGAMVALEDACAWLVREGRLTASPLVDSVAAISVGIVGGVTLLDLDYEEDARADVDFNVVMLGTGAFVEVQGTGERAAFSRTQMDEMMGLAQQGIDAVRVLQRGARGDA